MWSPLSQLGLSPGAQQWKHRIITTCFPASSQVTLRKRHHASWFQTIKETLIKILWLLFKSLSLDCSVVQLRPIFCDPMDCSMPGFPFLHYFLEFAQTHIYWVSDVIQPSHPLSPLVLLPSIFPSMRVFSSESALCIRWPQSWSFSFSTSPSSEYSGLISLRIDWFDLLAVQETLQESSPAP